MVDDLPPEIIALILNKLNNKDWYHFRLTCRKVYSVPTYKDKYKRLLIAHKKLEMDFLNEILEIHLDNHCNQCKSCKKCMCSPNYNNEMRCQVCRCLFCANCHSGDKYNIFVCSDCQGFYPLNI